MPIVYLLQPCILLKTNRYKIGRSNQSNLNRIRSYGNGSRYLSILECDDDSALEKILIEKFNKHFKLIGGNEYFEGNENEMLNLFITTVMDYKNKNNIVIHRFQKRSMNVIKDDEEKNIINVNWMQKYKYN